MFVRRCIFLMVMACGLPVAAVSAEPTITFSALSLPVTPGVNAVAFFTVTSTSDDAITDVDSSCCAAVELHQHTMEGGIMRMRRVASVPLKAHVPTIFASSSFHVMLIGLKQPLQPGTPVLLTFHFAHAPVQAVTFTAHAQSLQAAPDSPKHP